MLRSCSLFYLRADGWESISEDGLRRHLAGEFSAPLNIFRHRLPVVLRAKDVDLEVVDGLLGHGYGGCVTYGDWSTRQWQADMERASRRLRLPLTSWHYRSSRFLCSAALRKSSIRKLCPLLSSVLLAVSSSNANGVKLLGGRRVSDRGLAPGP
jgi:hypothetical protein